MDLKDKREDGLGTKMDAGVVTQEVTRRSIQDTLEIILPQ